jgi:hypothetical protein
MDALREAHRDDPVALALIDECDALGPEGVRLRMDGNHYGGLIHIPRNWLINYEARARAVLEERTIKAAETQAAYARRAFWISVAAIAISVLALIVAAAQAAGQGMG